MFGGFKARLNLFGGKKNKKELQSEISPDMCVSGAYRTSRDDFFGYNNSFDQTKKTAPEQASQQIRPTKSTSDLTKVKNVTPKTRNSTPEVSRDPRGAELVDLRNGSQKDAKKQEKEQNCLEKQRLAEQKAREKQAAQEQAKQERLKREREKREAQQNKQKRNKRPEKRQAPKPQTSQSQAATAEPQASQYSTNTLESSISRSSGPPPYSDVPQSSGPPMNAQNATDKSGNVIYSKPVDTGSWDMISQHREQIIRPTATVGGGKQSKQMVMDLNYNFGGNTSHSKDNSDA